MSRPLRIEYEGAIYHITSRGNERWPIYGDEKDRLCFFRTLADAKDRFNWLIHAYCLMDNHYHLVVETVDGNLAHGMRQLNGVYTQRYNKRHERAGHLFQGRYKAILIQKDSHMLEACRYVVLNPVRASIAEKPGEYKWSSYNATAGRTAPEKFLTTDWILSQFDGKKHQTQRLYEAFALDGISEKKKMHDGFCHQAIFGNTAFTVRVAGLLKSKEELSEVTRKQRHIGRPSIEDVLSGVNSKGDRKRRIIALIYKHGYTQKQVAEYLRVHYSTISKLLSR